MQPLIRRLRDSFQPLSDVSAESSDLHVSSRKLLLSGVHHLQPYVAPDLFLGFLEVRLQVFEFNLTFSASRNSTGDSSAATIVAGSTSGSFAD